MLKIVKQSSWLKQNGLLVAGVFYITMFLIAVILGEWKSIILIGMFVIGLSDVYSFLKLKKGNMLQEFISWDEEKIVVGQYHQEPLVYSWQEVDQIKVTEENLTIKSGAANGIMFELKGFKKEDLKQLQGLATTKFPH